MFKAPWQSDHIVSHLADQHTEQFKTYSALTDKQKKVFFDEPSSSSPDLTRNNSDTSISARFFRRPIATDTALNVFVDKSIVEGLIGDLVFDPDPSSIVDDELSDYLEANIRQRIGCTNDHTRERFLSEFILEETGELIVEQQPEQEGFFRPPAQEDNEEQDYEQVRREILLGCYGGNQQGQQGTAAALEDERGHDDAADGPPVPSTTTTMLTSMEDIRQQQGKEVYVAYVPSTVQYHSCIKMVSSGLSFRQTSRVMHDMKETLGLTTLGGSVSPQRVSSLIRIAFASNLQTSDAMLRSAWAFSIALDGGNKSDTSYLDVKVRVCIEGKLFNLHLIAIPMRSPHWREYVQPRLQNS